VQIPATMRAPGQVETAPRPLIEARGLAVGYDNQPILEQLDFDVAAGAVLALLGGSGCGKSTLMRNLVGFDRPIAGSVRWNVTADGGLVQGAPRFGILFQSGALFGSSTLLENVALPLESWTGLPASAIDAVARAKLRLVGLDPITSAEIDELLLLLNGQLGMTLVVVTHELASLHRIATDCLLLDREARGAIARGSPRELADGSRDPRVQRFFHPHARSRA